MVRALSVILTVVAVLVTNLTSVCHATKTLHYKTQLVMTLEPVYVTYPWYVTPLLSCAWNYALPDLSLILNLVHVQKTQPFHWSIP